PPPLDAGRRLGRGPHHGWAQRAGVSGTGERAAFRGVLHSLLTRLKKKGSRATSPTANPNH
nr:hypothetical protein [Tanacetum cinerariifolium]